jgi:hypothetical protein
MMTFEDINVIRFGTTEPSSQANREFTAGQLRLSISGGAVRNLFWHGIEVVRGIACPVRDANWATCNSLLADESVTITQNEFEISQVRLVADGALRINLVYKGNADGTFRATAEMSATREFITNRAGFTLLHPLQHVVGTPLSVIHPDGSIAKSLIPLLISPEQVAADISGLRHSVDGIDTEIMFRGEVFEMEDQRNWSDASFKTYCRPLSRPFPYRLSAGEVQRQEIHIRLRGTPEDNATTASAVPEGVLKLRPCTESIPHLAVAIDDGTIPDHRVQELSRLIKPGILQLRVTPETALRVCEGARSILSGGAPEIELEIIIPSNDEPEKSIARVAADCKSASLAVARVLALPERYLRSYQPTGPWPTGPGPQDLLKYARQSFPNADIGVGALTYFTELNRCRPRADTCGYVGHGSTAITHAADDCSVIESLEGLSHVYRSAGALAGGRDYRLGLVAIGMRSNPYGSGVMENILQNRIAMAGADPRQRGLFAAAWAVGALAATEGNRVLSLALSAFVGPFGAIHRRESWVQPAYNESSVDLVYPIFHVVRFLSAMGGAPRLSVLTASSKIVGVASHDRSGIRLIITNLGTELSRVRLPCEAEIRFLSTDSFQSAIHDPHWLDTSESDHGPDMALEPFDVAFVSMPV